MKNKLSELSMYFEKHGLKPTPWGFKNGISPATLSRYLRGKSQLTPENALKISEATNGEVPIMDLLY